jgi:ABC-2 type transport system permease protein
MNKVWIIVRKEWAEVFKNRFVLFTVGFLPLLFTALPLIMLYATRDTADFGGLTTADMPSGFQSICGGEMTAAECGQYFVISQFMLLFMIMPLAIPVTIASYSIVGEKTTRTLEPVLATPITTIELLVGKGLAAILPAIGATWFGFGIFAAGASILSTSPAVLGRLADVLWLTAIFVVGPLLSIAAVSVAVMVSSRTNDPRVAEQLSMLVILPLLGIFFGQITGLFFINDQLIVWMAAILLIVDAGLVALATHLFQRETILTRWK